MLHSSPPKRIAPEMARSVARRVRLFRAQLTEEKLELGGVARDDSFASLVALVYSKWLATLLERHNDPCDDLVYMNITSLWFLAYFLFNIYRNIECCRMSQLNGNATYCINRAGVASLSLGVNSIGHVNNPISWAIIPEKTEGRITYSQA